MSPVVNGRRGDSKREAGTHDDGGHHVDIEGQVGAAIEQPVDAVGAEHVGDLVRVGHDRRGAMGQDGPSELVDRQLGGLDMHVRVDEPGHEVGAGDVLTLTALIAPKPDDVAVLDGDVDVEPLLGEYGEHLSARQHEVGRLVTPRDCHPMRVDGSQNTATLFGRYLSGRARSVDPQAFGPGRRNR